MYFQTGSVVGRSYTGDGEFNNARVPIQQLTANSGGGKLQMLIGNYNHYLDMIRTVTGLNEARDGTSPDPNALVGVQKLAALNSNVATRHILDASLFIARRLAECLTIRTADILKYADFKEEFAMQIGKYNLAILEDIKELYIYDFGVFIELAPDEEQKAMLEQNIQMALSKENISLEDAIDIREIHNLKMANQLLKVKRKKKQEAEQQAQMQAQQMQAQQAMQQQQAAAEIAMQKQKMETEGKIAIEQAKISYEIQKLTAEKELKLALMAEEFQYNMQLKGQEQSQIDAREKEKEEGKSKRISQQSTQTSKMIEQKKKRFTTSKF